MRVENLMDTVEDEQIFGQCMNKIYECLLELNAKDYQRLYYELEELIWAQNGHKSSEMGTKRAQNNQN